MTLSPRRETIISTITSPRQRSSCKTLEGMKHPLLSRTEDLIVSTPGELTMRSKPQIQS